MANLTAKTKIVEITKPGDGWKSFTGTGEHIVVCVCGFVDGFRVFEDGELIKVLSNHKKECSISTAAL